MKTTLRLALCSLLSTACGPVLLGADAGANDACTSDGTSDGGCAVVPSRPSSPSMFADCERYCQRASSLPCTNRLGEGPCTDACNRARAVLASASTPSAATCLRAFDAVLLCRSTSTLVCDESSGDVTAPACTAQEAAAENCGN